MAVGRGFRDHLGGDVGAAAGPVLDHDLLAPQSRQRIGHDAGGDVGRPAGRERHDQPHEAVRKGLRLRAADDGGREQKRGGGGCQQSSAVDHGAPCSMPVFLM